MDISIIIPVYNGKEYLSRCLASVFTEEGGEKEVIIIDNASDDGTEKFIKENYPQAVFIKNNKNEGACFARNRGIAKAKGRFIMFLDNDAYLEKGFFLKLRESLNTLPPDIGSVSAKIININSKKVFSCGLKVSDIYRVYDAGKNRFPEDFNQPFFVDGPNSCCGIYKRDVLDKLKEDGYFDEGFFFLFEDADLALRLKKKGYKCLFVPSLVCYHYGASAPISQDYRRFLCFRNRWFMILKHNRGIKLVTFLLKSFFYDLVRTVYFALTNRYFIKAVREITLYKKKMIRNS